MAYTEDDDDFEEQRAQQLAEIEARQAQQMEEQERIAYEMEEKVLRNKLNTMKQTVSKKLVPLYTPSEKNTIKKAKRHPSLKPVVSMVEFQMIQQKAQFAQKIMSSIAPALPYIGYAFLILIALIIIIAVLSQLLSWMFPGFDLNQGVTSMFGASGKDFYGCRTIYKDEEEARVKLLQDYAGAVSEAMTEIQSIKSIQTADGSFDLEITILNESKADLITLPKPYFYESLDENEFKTECPELWTMTSGVVDNVYKADNKLNEIPNGATLTDKLDGIKYFGMGLTESTNLKTLVAEYVKTHYSFEFVDPSATGLPTQTDAKALIEAQMDEKLDAFYSQNRFKFRTEKLFVRDFIFLEEDDRMSGILSKNYVQMIFMPKRDLEFVSFSVDVVNPEDGFNIKLIENGNEITLSKEDGVTADNGNTNVRYASNNNLNIQAQTFTAIDVNNLTALAGENSFIEVLSLKDVDHTKYLTEITDEDGNVYLTWTQGQVYYEFESTSPFIFVEFETIVDEAV